MSFGKRELLVIAALLFLFVAIRLPGLSLPYHQDEWKNAEMVRIGMEGGLSAHPPLMELMYQWSGDIFGADNLRLMPLTFGVLSAWLLYAVVRRRLGMPAAVFATGLYALSVYGALASLMLDMDGTILPTFFLAAVYAYDRFLESGNVRTSMLWLAALFIAVLLGFLIKLSFVLVPAALALDYAWRMRKHLSLSMLGLGGVVLVACAAVFVGALFLAHKLLPAFDISATMSHALSYVRFEGRGYMQIFIQGIKAVLYLSPLLILVPIFLTKELIEKNRVFLIYGIVGFIFYFILFDFSEGALDKYLMYSIVPLCAIAGSILGSVFSGRAWKDLSLGFFVGAIGSVLMIALTALLHQVMPLYPKTAWLSAMASGDWNILFPFTGGNGPLGFYISFAMMAGAFILCAVIAVAGKAFSAFRLSAITALVVIGLAYNAVFMQELYWGTLYGSAPSVLEKSLDYIAGDENITSVLTHADAGAYELRGMGKYVGRFYAVPDYAEGHRKLFREHTGHYLVVDVPLLNKEGFYRRFFDTCETVFATSSGVISAYVYDCAESDPYAIK
jgi:hypothetical protein